MQFALVVVQIEVQTDVGRGANCTWTVGLEVQIDPPEKSNHHTPSKPANLTSQKKGHLKAPQSEESKLPKSRETNNPRKHLTEPKNRPEAFFSRGSFLAHFRGPKIHPKSENTKNTVFTRTFSKSSCELLLLPCTSHGTRQKLFRNLVQMNLFVLDGFFRVDFLLGRLMSRERVFLYRSKEMSHAFVHVESNHVEGHQAPLLIFLAL